MTIERLHFAGGIAVSTNPKEYAIQVGTLIKAHDGDFVALSVGCHALGTDMVNPSRSRMVNVEPDGRGTLTTRPLMDGPVAIAMRRDTSGQEAVRTPMGPGGESPLIVFSDMPHQQRRVHDILRFVPGPSPVAKK